MRNANLIAVFILFIASISPARSFASDTATWLLPDLEPFSYEVDGEVKGYGYNWLMMIQAEVSQYDHRASLMNYQRIFATLKSQDKVAAISIFKTSDREKFLYFSINDFMYHPPVLYMQKTTKKKLGGVVSLKELLDSKMGILGIAAKRRYDPVLENVLKNCRTNKEICKEVSTGKVGENLLKMLDLGRVDFVIDYIEDAQHIIQKANLDRITYSVIEENSGQYPCTHIVAPKTPWGKAFIERCNQALLKLRYSEQFIENYTRFLLPETRPAYLEAYKMNFCE